MKNNYTCEVFNMIQYALATIQDNPIWQGIQLGLSILTSVVLIAYRIWKWHNEATADGKITKDEVEEGFKIVNDGLEDINGKVNGKDNDKVNGKDKSDNG